MPEVAIPDFYQALSAIPEYSRRPRTSGSPIQFAASIHRHSGSQYYHAAYLGPDGRRILRSTKQQDREAALAVALEFERASKLARRGELVEAQGREVLRDIMKRADIGETIQSASIKTHFDGWLTSKRARKSEATGKRYGMAVNAFLKTLGKRATLPLTLTARDVENFLNARTAESNFSLN